jgi:hypothetical protein
VYDGAGRRGGEEPKKTDARRWGDGSRRRGGEEPKKTDARRWGGEEMGRQGGGEAESKR